MSHNQSCNTHHLPFLLSVRHTFLGTHCVAIAGEYEQWCMHAKCLYGLQEATQPSTSEPVHPDSGNALQQVFARQAVKLLNSV